MSAVKSALVCPLTDIEVRDSGAGEGQMTIRGHAAVFNRLSHDLGGFRERIAPNAFERVLDQNPDVHLVWDHDTSLVLARTTNKTLELREDGRGLHIWARMAPTSYAQDLRVLMERGDVDQMSFAFTVDNDEWHEDESGEITRTINRVGGLYDVTVCAQGAYPQTDVQLVRSLLNDAITSGRVLGRAADAAQPDAVDAEQDNAPEPSEVGAAAVDVAAVTRRLAIARRRIPTS